MDKFNDLYKWWNTTVKNGQFKLSVNKNVAMKWRRRLITIWDEELILMYQFRYGYKFLLLLNENWSNFVTTWKEPTTFKPFRGKYRCSSRRSKRESKLEISLGCMVGRSCLGKAPTYWVLLSELMQFFIRVLECCIHIGIGTSLN